MKSVGKTATRSFSYLSLKGKNINSCYRYLKPYCRHTSKEQKGIQLTQNCMIHRDTFYFVLLMKGPSLEFGMSSEYFLPRWASSYRNLHVPVCTQLVQERCTVTGQVTHSMFLPASIQSVLAGLLAIFIIAVSWFACCASSSGDKSRSYLQLWMLLETLRIVVGEVDETVLWQQNRGKKVPSISTEGSVAYING